jgi:hypothetical protein
MLGALFGLSPIGRPERDQLFARLLDDSQWSALEKPAKPRTENKPRTVNKPRAVKAAAAAKTKARKRA